MHIRAKLKLKARIKSGALPKSEVPGSLQQKQKPKPLEKASLDFLSKPIIGHQNPEIRHHRSRRAQRHAQHAVYYHQQPLFPAPAAGYSASSSSLATEGGNEGDAKAWLPLHRQG